MKTLATLTLAVILQAGCSGKSESPKEKKAAAKDNPAVAAIKKLGAEVEVDDSGNPIIVALDNKKTVTDEVLEQLKGLSKLKELGLMRAKFTDAGLVHLQGLKNLEYLSLGYTAVSDAGLVHLKGLTKLENLDLSDTKVTDAGLSKMGRWTKLEFLDLSDCKVTDAAVKKLTATLPNCDIIR